MNFFSELDELISASDQKKRLTPIGIYGSFQPGNVQVLEALKNYLSAHGYLVFLSLDLEPQFPRPPSWDPDKYNLKISLLMTRVCQIHIVCFFREKDGEHNVNQSASIELGRLEGDLQIHVLILYEEGSRVQSRSLARGLYEANIDKWAHDSFTRPPGDSDLEQWSMFCYGRMFSDPGLGYQSIGQLEQAFAQNWEILKEE